MSDRDPWNPDDDPLPDEDGSDEFPLGEDEMGGEKA